MRRILLLALVLYSIGSLQAQDLPAQEASSALLDRATQLLDSEDIRAQTWGVFLAGQYHLTGLLPRVIAYLTLPSNEVAVSDAQECLYRSLVDSLIRLDADLPAEMLTRLYGRYPDESVILFARSPQDKVNLLLTLFQRPMPPLRWQAIGNLLAEVRARGFADLLMEQMKEINVSIAVWENAGGIGCGGGSGFGITDRRVPDGFPPVALYALTIKPEHTAGVVAPHPHPIYYRRWVFEPGDKFRLGAPSWAWNSHCGDGRDDLRFEYLAMMLGERVEDVKFDSKPNREIQWKGPTAYLQEVWFVCTHVLERYDDLVMRLVAFGLLTQSEAGALNARVHLRINDQRENKGIPLPDIILNRVVVEQ